VGVELVTDRSSKEPDGGRARRVRDRMRHLGVLVGTTGQHGNVLKIRPPLAFSESEAPIVADALDAALTQTA
jgi:4-aminobutyrate aminotransferase-like enzyme